MILVYNGAVPVPKRAGTRRGTAGRTTPAGAQGVLGQYIQNDTTHTRHNPSQGVRATYHEKKTFFFLEQ